MPIIAVYYTFLLFLWILCVLGYWSMLSKWAVLTILKSSYCLTTVKWWDRLLRVIYVELQDCLINWCDNDMFTLSWQLTWVMQIHEATPYGLFKQTWERTDFLLSSAEMKITEELCFLTKESLKEKTTWVVDKDPKKWFI